MMRLPTNVLDESSATYVSNSMLEHLASEWGSSTSRVQPGAKLLKCLDWPQPTRFPFSCTHAALVNWNPVQASNLSMNSLVQPRSAEPHYMWFTSIAPVSGIRRNVLP